MQPMADRNSECPVVLKTRVRLPLSEMTTYLEK